MPHCIVEYSRNLEETVNISALVSTVFYAANESALFEKSDIKVRATCYEVHMTGLDRDDFVHVCIKMLPGRSAKQKKLLADLVVSEIALRESDIKSITVEVVEIDGDSYSKRVNRI